MVTRLTGAPYTTSPGAARQSTTLNPSRREYAEDHGPVDHLQTGGPAPVVDLEHLAGPEGHGLEDPDGQVDREHPVLPAHDVPHERRVLNRPQDPFTRRVDEAERCGHRPARQATATPTRARRGARP